MNKQFDIGWLVKSKQGRDKDEIYFIVGFDGDKVLLANGQAKLLSSPKRKNKRHLELLSCNEIIQEKLKNDIKVFDAEIYSNIKKYKENI